MKRLLMALVVGAFLFPMPVRAADRCYSPDEVNAEQVLRLHSELMVITVTCKQGSTGRDLVRAYTGFTQRHVGQIKKAEETMARYYAKTSGGNGLSQLDKLRTKLANEFGQKSAGVSAPVFCAERRDMVTTMYDSPPASLEKTSLTLYGEATTYLPSCGGEVKVAMADSPVVKKPKAAATGSSYPQRKPK